MSPDISVINDLIARADKAGHVLLTRPEVSFALSAVGQRYLVSVDVTLGLYKLTPMALERLGLQRD
jgi:hypothetical protein